VDTTVFSILMICIFSHSSFTILNYLFFFFLLQAAFKVATNRSAILSKSASRSLFSSSVRTNGAGVTDFIAGSNLFLRSVSGIIFFFLSSKQGATSSLVSSSSSGRGEKTASLSSRSRLISSSKHSSSGNRRFSGVPSKLPSLLLARAEVLAMDLLSPAAALLRSRRAAVAANAGGAVAGVAAAGVAAAGAAAAGAAAAGAAAVGAAAAGATASGEAAAGAATARAAAAGVAAVGAAAAGAYVVGAAAARVAAAEVGASGPAAEWRAALLVSFHTSRLFLSFSLLISLGGLFLVHLREVAATEEGALS
jgi:hypothetical protein